MPNELINIEIKNCNNVDNAKIALEAGVLNIKYGINGTGKSTIAKALQFSVKDKADGTSEIHALQQFKCIGNSENMPSVSGIDSINSVMTFDGGSPKIL